MSLAVPVDVVELHLKRQRLRQVQRRGEYHPIVKPAPVIAAELTVTGDVPVDVRVNVSVVAVFTVTLKLRLPALTVSWGLSAAMLNTAGATAAVDPSTNRLIA